MFCLHNNRLPGGNFTLCAAKHPIFVSSRDRVWDHDSQRNPVLQPGRLHYSVDKQSMPVGQMLHAVHAELVISSI